MTTFTGLLEVISRYFDTVSETLVFMNYSFRNFRNQYFAAVVSRYNYNPLVNKSSKVLWKMFNYGVPITRKHIKRSNLLALCFVPRPCNFRLKCFLVNFSKFLGTPFLQNTSGLLLLRFDWSHAQGSSSEKTESGVAYVMFFKIWYHLWNLKNVKNAHGRVLLFVKLQACRKKSQ